MGLLVVGDVGLVGVDTAPEGVHRGNRTAVFASELLRVVHCLICHDPR
jgi:hypothetical protein